MTELCVRCGIETTYALSTPVTARLYFVEGSGQLCSACWHKLYVRESVQCEYTRLSQQRAD